MLDRLAYRIAPHNPGRAGRIAAGIVLWVIFIAAFAFVLGMMVVIAKAHEASTVAGQPLGWEYPTSCCSLKDCRPAAAGEVRETSEGYRLTTTGEIVGYLDKRVKDSPSGDFHVCQQAGNFDSGRILCLFRPSRGF